MRYIVCLMFLTGCTYSVNLIHSQGKAEDMIDEQQEAKPDVSPTISVPASLM